jgi:hypothetical protein
MEPMEDQVPDQVDEADDVAPKKECVLCEKIAALIGCFIGGFVFLIGLDLITKGAISRRVNRNDVVFPDVLDSEEEAG